MWSCDQILVGCSSIFMREVIISQIIYGFVQKTDFEGWSWFNVNNLGLALGMALKFYSSVAKRLKLKVKVLRETRKGAFFTFPLLPSWVVLKMIWQIPVVKTVKKENYRFHYSIACSVELTCIFTVIILENTFGNIKINCFYLRGNRVGEIALLSLHVCRCSTSACVRL